MKKPYVNIKEKNDRNQPNFGIVFERQCKEAEWMLCFPGELIKKTYVANNRMGKTRDLFKKTRDTKGIYHAKMGSIKDRNGMDLTEPENIKKVARIHRRTVQKRSS